MGRGEVAIDRALEGRLESAVRIRRWSDHITPVYTAVQDRGQLPAALAALAAAPEEVARTDGFFFYEYAILGELDAALAATRPPQRQYRHDDDPAAPRARAAAAHPGIRGGHGEDRARDYWRANGMPDLCAQKSGEIVCR